MQIDAAQVLGERLREVGATQRCTLKAGADTYGVTVTVTSVQGTDVKFDIQVDQTPISSPSR